MGCEWTYPSAVLALGTVSLFVLSACAVTQPEINNADIETITTERLTMPGGWTERLDTISPDPITQNTAFSATAAIQFALLNHPQMKASFAELGIARADLMEAGLLPNPVVEFGARFPDRSPHATGIEFNILGSVVELLLRPDNTRIKALAVDAAILRFSAELMQLATEVETAFIQLQGALQRHAALVDVDTANRATAVFIEKMRVAGNIGAIPAVRTAALAEQAGIQVLRATLSVDEARAALAHSMGVGDPAELPPVNALLPELPPSPLGAGDALAIALAERLDLAAARKAVDVEAARHQVTLDWGWLNTLQVGVWGERDTDRQFSIGPSLQFDLPIFNRGQAQQAGTAAKLQQKQHQVAALALDIESQVRLAERRVGHTHAIAKQYQDKVLPLHEELESLARRQQAFMLTGATGVIAARREALAVSSDYVHALSDYWVAVAALRRALGGHELDTR